MTVRKKGKLPQDFKRQKQIKFLGRLIECGGNVTRAIEGLAVARSSINTWKKYDEQFREDYEEAMEIAADVLQDEMIRRGFEGVLEPVFRHGIRVGAVRKFSDNNLHKMLKALKPEMFGDKQHLKIEDHKVEVSHTLSPSLREKLDAERKGAKD